MGKFADFSVCTKDALDYSCKMFAAELTENQKDALMDEYKILPTFPDVEIGDDAFRNEIDGMYFGS